MAGREERALVSGGLWVLQFRAAKIATALAEHVTTRKLPGEVDGTARRHK